MISKNQIKIIRSLKQKKYRQKYNKFVCEGVKVIDELIGTRPDLIENVYMTSQGVEKLSRKPEIDIEIIEEKDLRMISSLSTNHDGLAIVKMEDQSEDVDWDQGTILYLDGVRDPGNLGTIIRLCDWFGLKHLLLSHDCVDPFNPKVVQSSMGSLWRVSWKFIDLQEVTHLSRASLIGADMIGHDYKSFDFPEKYILVMGGESNGLSEKSRELIDQLISIPKVGQEIESLNVAVATSILVSHGVK